MAVELMVGASLTLVTVMLKDWSAVKPSVSVTRNVTGCAPTSALPGVPLSTPVAALKLNQLGLVTALKVKVSPTSVSLAAKV